MMGTKKQKLINTIFFIVLVIASFYLIYKSRNSNSLFLYTILGVATIYLGWAAIFHKIDKSLTLPIFLEYLLTAVLVLILLLAVLV